MISKEQKINILKNYLSETSGNYADSFKTDILFFIDDYNAEDDIYNFLNILNSKKEIQNWVDRLTSRIVLKFDGEFEQLSDFIHDYIELG